MSSEILYIPAQRKEPDTPISEYYVTIKPGFVGQVWLVKKRRKYWFDKTMAKFEYESYERGKQLAINLATTLEEGIAC